MSEAFKGHARHNNVGQGYRKSVYVPLGTDTRSLWAVDVDRKRFRFIEEDSFGEIKLRARFWDDEAAYDLRVSSTFLQGVYRREGLDGVNDLLPSSGRLHVRLGLARRWDQKPNECAMMVNGVFW